MRYVPAEGNNLERYEVEDSGTFVLANEYGDLVAWVERSDGTTGHAYGGPVYDPPEFANVCERPFPYGPGRTWVCDHASDLTPAELAVANVFARKVGWT